MLWNRRFTSSAPEAKGGPNPKVYLIKYIFKSFVHFVMFCNLEATVLPLSLFFFSAPRVILCSSYCCLTLDHVEPPLGKLDTDVFHFFICSMFICLSRVSLNHYTVPCSTFLNSFLPKSIKVKFKGRQDLKHRL